MNKKELFDCLDFKDGDKIFIIRIRRSEDGYKQQRINHGFDPYALMGLTDTIKSEIQQQLTGELKPKIVSTERIVIPEDEEETREPIWRTSDGREILISKMDDDHLCNSIRYMHRHGFVSTDVLSAYLFGPVPNGDHARDAFEQELDHVIDKKPSHILSCLEHEAKKRGLKYA